MATDMPVWTQTADDRWQRMWGHREQLLKVARRRSMSPEDAEDAVQEAMLRAAERPDLDDERLGAWLTTVTVRLCVDRYRQANREAEVHRSPTLVMPGPAPVEDAVCDRAEARWLAVRSGELPARQAEALRLKSEDLDVGQVAVRMGLSYRTVESLLARARRTLRNSLAGTFGFALFLWGRGKLRSGGHVQAAVAVTSTACTLVVAGCVLPYVHYGNEQGAASGPSVSRGAETPTPTVRPDGGGRAATPNALDLPAAPATPTPGDHGRLPSLLPRSVSVSVPSLPDAPLPPVPSVPDVRDLPDVPRVSDLPSVPALPGLPAASTLPSTVPVLPEAPATLP
ncbi:sigma-70 family RNA polymerase sigma factor [Streptomyces sp. NPDC005262]|uniref:sigma-70 family RNA polymerase sigma factor n=1 Tax=Streptomyces sp. NPDC005262 TaxID=3364710 RepID=UPI003683806C